MRIAVSGCGIAGAAVAYLLAKSGHEVTVFEQSPECKPIGAGIMLQPSGQKILKRFGILDLIERQSSRLEGLDAFLRSGRPLIRLRYASLDEHSHAIGVHRGLLFDQLHQLCVAAGASVITSAMIVAYTSDEREVHLRDQSGGEHGPFDFLIATDGSRSLLRKVSGIPHRAVEYPYAAIWTTGPCSTVDNKLFQVIDSTTRLVGLLPIGSGQCSFFWGLRADRYDDLIEHGVDAWKESVATFSPAAIGLLDSITSFDQMTFAGYRHVRMRRWYADRIVFLGDAAHASSPHLGQGANLALEDAVCFADALADCDDFVIACHNYQRQRWRKLRYYQQLTRLLSPFFQSDVPLLATGRNGVLPWMPHVPWLRRRMLRTLCGEQPGWLG